MGQLREQLKRDNRDQRLINYDTMKWQGSHIRNNCIVPRSWKLKGQITGLRRMDGCRRSSSEVKQGT